MRWWEGMWRVFANLKGCTAVHSVICRHLNSSCCCRHASTKSHLDINAIPMHNTSRSEWDVIIQNDSLMNEFQIFRRNMKQCRADMGFESWCGLCWFAINHECSHLGVHKHLKHRMFYSQRNSSTKNNNSHLCLLPRFANDSKSNRNRFFYFGPLHRSRFVCQTSE